MPQSFDIRFARSAGLAALFETPENSFRWRGAGLLSIDSQGMNFSVRRDAASLLAERRAHRISADSIREVYREGEAVRVEFSTDENARTVLPFWARDREAAAQIVRLLPTSRTIEIEDSPAESRGKPASKQLLLLLALAAITAGGAWYFVRKPISPHADMRASLPITLTPQQDAQADVTTPVPAGAEIAAPVDSPGASESKPAESSPAEPDYAAPTSETTAPTRAAALPATAPAAKSKNPMPTAATPEAETDGFVPIVPAIRVLPESFIVPIKQGTLAYDAARGLLARFEEGAKELAAEYERQRARSDSGELSARDFAAILDSNADKWRELALRVLDNREAKDPALIGFSATLLAAATYQKDFLASYAAGLRAGDASAVEKSFELLQQAEDMLARARLYLR